MINKLEKMKEISIEKELQFINNLNAISIPTKNDDESKGYQVRSIWIYDGTIYTCTDSTLGSAVWKEETLENKLGG